jgi:hypothetical protein
MLSQQQLQNYLAWTPLQRLQQVEQIRQLLIAAAGADAGSYDRIRAADPSRDSRRVTTPIVKSSK